MEDFTRLVFHVLWKVASIHPRAKEVILQCQLGQVDIGQGLRSRLERRNGDLRVSVATTEQCIVEAKDNPTDLLFALAPVNDLLKLVQLIPGGVWAD